MSRFANCTMKTRLFSLCALAAVLLVAGGCDSSGDAEDGDPLVQFAASSVTVTEEDSLASVPVVLTRPTSQSVTVEVLLAFAASDADADDLNLGDLDDDDDNFRGDGNAYIVETIEFDGAAADTVNVTFDVTDDDDAENREVAFFGLQNVQGPPDVEIGSPNELELSIGYPLLSEVRERDLGETATVLGTVTRIAQSRTIYLQDESAGFVAFAPDLASETQPGDQITATGEVDVFAGLSQISSLSSLNVISSDNPLPAPATATLAELGSDGEAYEAELVRVEGLTFTGGGTFEAQTNYAISDGSGGAVDLRVPSGSFYVGQPIPSGEVTFQGVLGQFNGEFDSIEPNSGYQLLALQEGDLIQ